MARRRTEPAKSKPASAGARVLFGRRAKLLQELKRLEWDFDRKSTKQAAGELRDLRDRVSGLEAAIAVEIEDAAMEGIIARLRKIEESVVDRADNTDTP